MTKSEKTLKVRQKFDFGIEPKSKTLLCPCYALGWLLKPSGIKKFFEEGAPPWPIVAGPGSAPVGRSCRENNNTSKGLWVLHQCQVSSKSIKQSWRRS